MDPQISEDRIKALEARVAQLEARQTTPPPGLPGAVSSAFRPPPPPPGSSTPHQTTPAPRQSGGLESWIGKHGLSFAGIALLVLGIGFFLVYTLQYLGAGGKDAVGLIAVVILFVISRFVEKSSRRFSQVIFAGAAALLYFTVYAMYYFPAAQIFSSEVLCLSLLLVVSVVVTAYSVMHYDDEMTALLAILLMYLTMNIGSFSAFTFPALLIVTLVAVGLAWKKGWVHSLLVITFVTYLTYLAWGAGLHTASGRPFAPSEQLSYDLFFLTVYYCLFAAPLFTLRSKLISLVAIINSLFFILILGSSLATIYPFQGPAVLLFVFALTGGGQSLIAQTFQSESLRKTSLSIACTALIGAIPFYFVGPMVGWGLLIISLGLILAGYASRERIFAWAGLVSLWFTFFNYLSVISEPTSYIGTTLISHRLALGVGLALVSLALGQSHDSRRALFPKVEGLFGASFNWIGLGVLAIVLELHLTSGFVSLSWGIVGVGALIAGIMIRDRWLRTGAFGLLIIMILRIVSIDLAGAGTLYRIVSFIIIGAFLLGASWVYHRYMAEPSPAVPAPASPPPPPRA